MSATDKLPCGYCGWELEAAALTPFNCPDETLLICDDCIASPTRMVDPRLFEAWTEKPQSGPALKSNPERARHPAAPHRRPDSRRRRVSDAEVPLANHPATGSSSLPYRGPYLTAFARDRCPTFEPSITTLTAFES